MSPAELPPHAALLRDFANTVDVEEGADDLTSADELRDWLAGHGLAASRDEVSADDLAVARTLRDGLRRQLVAHHDGPGAADPALEALAAQLPLRLTFTGAAPELAPAENGIRGGLAALIAAVAASGADGSWERLKICRSDTCAWAFYDVSKNRSRTWCAMGVCGNRAKTRSYRARKRAQPLPPPR